jgi:hypothetical protein
MFARRLKRILQAVKEWIKTPIFATIVISVMVSEGG